MFLPLTGMRAISILLALCILGVAGARVSAAQDRLNVPSSGLPASTISPKQQAELLRGIEQVQKCMEGDNKGLDKELVQDMEKMMGDAEMQVAQMCGKRAWKDILGYAQQIQESVRIKRFEGCLKVQESKGEPKKPSIR